LDEQEAISTNTLWFDKLFHKELQTSGRAKDRSYNIAVVKYIQL